MFYRYIKIKDDVGKSFNPNLHLETSSFRNVRKRILHDIVLSLIIFNRE